MFAKAALQRGGGEGLLRDDLRTSGRHRKIPAHGGSDAQSMVCKQQVRLLAYPELGQLVVAARGCFTVGASVLQLGSRCGTLRCVRPRKEARC